jgi:hypothetical protein
MRARLPRRKRMIVYFAQPEGDHPVGDIILALDPNVSLELAGDQGDSSGPMLEALDMRAMIGHGATFREGPATSARHRSG